jgi:TRAP-type uncharacterized transport system substrate-binding protein
MKRSFIFIILLLLAVMMGTGQTQERRLVIGTARTGVTWYSLGGGVATIITKYIKGVSTTAILF